MEQHHFSAEKQAGQSTSQEPEGASGDHGHCRGGVEATKEIQESKIKQGSEIEHNAENAKSGCGGPQKRGDNVDKDVPKTTHGPLKDGQSSSVKKLPVQGGSDDGPGKVETKAGGESMGPTKCVPYNITESSDEDDTVPALGRLQVKRSSLNKHTKASTPTSSVVTPHKQPAINFDARQLSSSKHTFQGLKERKNSSPTMSYAPDSRKRGQWTVANVYDNLPLSKKRKHPPYHRSIFFSSHMH